jgi:LmbE family N-acetylglucosaminyl deacetylase
MEPGNHETGLIEETMIRTIAILVVALMAIPISAICQQDTLNVLVFGAHPDDCDLDAGGTALLFSSMGHRVKFVSLTNGDVGHYDLGRDELARKRKAEAAEAGRRFGVTYKVLDNHDGELLPTLENRFQVIREIREWDADIVIAPRPNDYHPDHRYTGVIIQDAAFMVIVPNLVPDAPALKNNPVFLYSADHFQKPSPFNPQIAVDIGSVFSKKIYALAAHESQFFDWLPWLAGTLQDVPSGEKERLEYLAGLRQASPDAATRQSLLKWYGEKGASVKHAEAFEICEYGRQPSEEEIRELFPMLGK